MYLPPLTSGEWTGTMCLTESHCGTDLGLLRTKAEPQADGSYKLTGGKIFISAGEHEMSSNIVHLVLARLPGAPKGTKGISLFIVPKFIPNADGSVGARNTITCGAIEEKMGVLPKFMFDLCLCFTRSIGTDSDLFFRSAYVYRRRRDDAARTDDGHCGR